MAYAIMRCKKLKTFGGIAASLQHNYRERETPNADPTRTHLNQHYPVATTADAIALLRERLPEKRRKDATLCVEYLFTASPEWWQQASQEQQKQFFSASFQWLTRKYGRENVIAATSQYDETTPHMSVYVVPLTQDGRLSAKEFIGSRKLLSGDQTSFATAVAHLGLERGVEGSKARHTTIREYYAAINAPTPRTPSVEVPEPTLKERLTPYEYGRRVADGVIDAVQPTLTRLYQQQANSLADKQRAKDMAETAKKAQSQAAEADRHMRAERDKKERLAADFEKQIGEKDKQISDVTNELKAVCKLFTRDELERAIERANRIAAEKQKQQLEQQTPERKPTKSRDDDMGYSR